MLRYISSRSGSKTRQPAIRHAKHMLGHLCGHDVAIVAARGADERVRLAQLDLRSRMSTSRPLPTCVRAAEVLGKEAECRRVRIQHEYVVTIGAEVCREGRACAAAAHNDDLHNATSPCGSLLSHG